MGTSKVKPMHSDTWPIDGFSPYKFNEDGPKMVCGSLQAFLLRGMIALSASVSIRCQQQLNFALYRFLGV